MSSAPMIASGEDATAPRRRWGQFSLLSLLLLIVIGCVAAAWLGEKRRREEAYEKLLAKEEENRRLRIDLGILDDQPNVLTIGDPKQVHVRAMPTLMMDEQAIARRWRVYLPPETVWNVGVTWGTTWDEEQLKYQHGGGGSGGFLTGELTFDAYVIRDFGGTAYLAVSRGGGQFRAMFPEEAIAAVVRPGELTQQTTGRGNQETFDPKGRILLMRWHRQFSDAAKKTDVDGRPLPDEYGFAIYLQEASAEYQQLRQPQAPPGRQPLR